MGTPGTQTHDPRAAGTARDEGKQLAHTAADSTKQVASTVKGEASNVAGEVSTQVRSLAGQASDQVRGQVDQQRSKAAEALRTTRDEFSSLASKGEYSQLTNELTRRAAEQAGRVADYLENTRPSEILDQIRSFARRRPGAFLFAAALAGAAAGRLLRSATTEDTSTSAQPSPPTRDASTQIPSTQIPSQIPSTQEPTVQTPSTTYQSTGAELSEPLPPPPVPPASVGGVPPATVVTNPRAGTTSREDLRP